MKIVPEVITYKIAEIHVLPRIDDEMFPGEPVDIKIDPPLPGYGFEKLLRSRNIEVEDGRLVGFEALTYYEEQDELYYEKWHVKNGSWEVDYISKE